MAPVARELALVASVLEPFQTAESVEGQIEELKVILQVNSQPPVTLIGFSWGAWLSVLLAAKHPDIVNMLLLVGSGPFEEKYAGAVQETRLARLNESDWAKLKSLMEALEGAGATKRTRDLLVSEKLLPRPMRLIQSARSPKSSNGSRMFSEASGTMPRS